MSLNCYNCSSATNWDDCKQEKVTCPGASDRCITAYVKYGVNERFEKYCGTEAQCDTKNNPTCKLAEGFGSSACSVNCVKSDLYNAGSNVGASGMVMMACALVALVFLKA